MGGQSQGELVEHDGARNKSPHVSNQLERFFLNPTADAGDQRNDENKDGQAKENPQQRPFSGIESVVIMVVLVPHLVSLFGTFVYKGNGVSVLLRNHQKKICGRIKNQNDLHHFDDPLHVQEVWEIEGYYAVATVLGTHHTEQLHVLND